jgi:predicted GNAT family N-acyltransferase
MRFAFVRSLVTMEEDSSWQLAVGVWCASMAFAFLLRSHRLGSKETIPTKAVVPAVEGVKEQDKVSVTTLLSGTIISTWPRPLITLMHESPLCRFTADSGKTCPIAGYGNNTWKILPFQDVDETIQTKTCDALCKEWNDTYVGQGIEYSISNIKKEWSGGSDVLYVATDLLDNFIGCVAVDRKNFYPVISHLLVEHDKRHTGLGKELVKFAEQFVKHSLKFKEVRLWCFAALVPFYQKLGYSVYEEKSKNMLMVKRL